MQRTDRLNSLLKEVISEVLRKDVHHIGLPEMITITHVDVTKDLHHAKVYISVIGDDKARNEAVELLQEHGGQIGRISSKKVKLRFFPQLTFILDDSLDNQMRVEQLLKDLSDERESRQNGAE